ncbi:serine hydrolase domain-containing protein [Aliiglaciecola litoralis]|uniref:Serine hydrolase domain-containing protein n=1 Tax=Aliiglaciecola litoralis TaxID=582857 RepID=A0ABN1LTF2_9ALTE
MLKISQHVLFISGLQIGYLLLSPPSAWAKSDTGMLSIERKYETAVKSEVVPGISAAIADRSGVLWSKAFGLADVENSVQMTPSHKMRIGSVAKLITAAGMMRLFEQQKLSLDTPITKYVSTWPKKHEPLTLRQLASHTAGVRHYASTKEFLLNQPFKDVTSSLSLFKDDPLLFSPGSDHEYSTFAYSLIAAAMEGADQKRDFKQIITQEVFEPIDMQETAFDNQADIIALRQRPYTVKNGILFNAPQSDHSYKYAGGGFIASAADVARFAVAHSFPGYLSQESLNLLFTKATLDDGTILPFGISWMIDFDNYRERKYYINNTYAQTMMASFNNVAMHSGGSNGGLTMMILCIEHSRAVTVVKNVDNEYSADVFLLALESLYHFHSKN